MPYLMVRSKIEEYAKWRPVFDGHSAARIASGCIGTRVFRNSDNPNEVIVLAEWDEMAKARQFTQSQDMRQAMQRAGVVGPPDISFLEEAE